MYTHLQNLARDDVQELRQEVGRRLKALREGLGLSQAQLAGRLNLKVYTFISQLETGRGRIPPDKYGAWAEALEVERRPFVKMLMRFYDPVTYAELFGADEVVMSELRPNGARTRPEKPAPELWLVS